MKIAITGGAGYVGIELAYRLSADPRVEALWLIDNMSRAHFNVFAGLRKFSHIQPTLVEEDILNNHGLEKWLNCCDCVFHLAAATPNKQSPHSAHNYSQVNNFGTASIVDTVLKSDKQKKIINLSSIWADPVTRKNQCRDADASKIYYGISKEKGEQQLQVLTECSNHSYINVRAPTVFGYSKNLRLDSDLNKMLFDAVAYKFLVIESELKLPVQYTYIQHLVDMLHELAFDVSTASHHLYPPTMTIDHLDVLTYLKDSTQQLEFSLVDQGEYDLAWHDSSKLEDAAATVTPLVEYAPYLAETIKSFTIQAA